MRFSTQSSRLFALALLIVACAWAKSKNDVVVMVNGDKFTGEIKEISGVRLTFKADYMSSSVDLDWDKVDSIHSEDFFVITLNDGSRSIGHIAREAGKEEEQDIVISQGDRSIRTSPHKVIQVEPMERNFWRQLTGNVSLGLSYFNGNSATQFTTSGAVAYQAEKTEYSASLDSVYSSQSGAPRTVRNDLLLEYRRMLSRNWFGAGQLDFLHSTQQNLDLRTTVGAGIGRYLIRTSRMTLSPVAGLVYTRERYFADPDNSETTQSDLRRSNLEGLVGVDFTVYRFSNFTFDSRLAVFPSITQAGRVRVNANVTIIWEFMRNLTWNFTTYSNSDTRPPSGLPAWDFGVTNAVGWKF